MTQRTAEQGQGTEESTGTKTPATGARSRQLIPLTSSIALVSQFPSKATGILTRKDRRTVRRRLSITTITVVILTLIIASIGNYLSVPHTPEDTVSRYLTALEKGDYLNGIDRSAYIFSNTYITDSAYRRAESRVQGYRIVETTMRDSTASVNVAVTIDDEEQYLTLPLSLTHKTGPYNDSWTLAVPAHTDFSLTSPVALSRITVNGTNQSLPTTRRIEADAGYSWSLPLLPGTYTLGLPQDSYYSLVGGEQEVTVALPTQLQESDSIELSLRPSPRMWGETESLIQSWLERCESSRRLRINGCPTSARHGEDSTATIDDVRWELTRRPALVLVQDSRSPNVWRASKYAPAIFEVTYLENGKAQRETIPFYINAQVVSDGNQADISVGVGNHRETLEQLTATITREGAARSTLEKLAARYPGGTP